MTQKLFTLTKVVIGALVAISTITPANAADRHVRIVNNTSETLWEFYASNVDNDIWEEDILGLHVLSPGESVLINFDDGTGDCRFDFKGVFDEGDLVRNGVNVCRTAVFRFND